jgi:hypothetical protein
MSDTAATAPAATAPVATAATTAPAPPPAPEPVAPEPTAPALAAGNLVSYTWEDTYAPGPDGKGAPRTRYGIVVAVPAAVEGEAQGRLVPPSWQPEAPTVTVSWLEGTATMPAELLDAVTGA